jgi:hypothetical protein
MKSTLTFVAPTCTCCAEPSPLLPRDDLAAGLAVCGATGQLYRPEGAGYLPTAMPDLALRERPLSSVKIDLSRSGYA